MRPVAKGVEEVERLLAEPTHKNAWSADDGIIIFLISKEGSSSSKKSVPKAVAELAILIQTFLYIFQINLLS